MTSDRINSNTPGTLTSQQRYLPFGGVRTDVDSITVTDYGYTGQRNLDDEIGLMDYNFRFYSDTLGRFISPDNITPGGPQGLNRYSYVVNNPVRFNDPTGHCPEEDSACRDRLKKTLPKPIPPKPDDDGGEGDGNRNNDYPSHGGPLFNGTDDLRGTVFCDMYPDAYGCTEYHGQPKSEYDRDSIFGSLNCAVNAAGGHTRDFVDCNGRHLMFDGSRVSWPNVVLDLAGIPLAVFGLNTYTGGLKVSMTTANAFSGTATTAQAFVSFRKGDYSSAATTEALTIVGLIPGPPGVVANSISLYSDLSLGYYYSKP